MIIMSHYKDSYEPTSFKRRFLEFCLGRDLNSGFKFHNPNLEEDIFL